MSKYQLVKIGQRYGVRKRMFLIGPWVYYKMYGGWKLFNAYDFSDCEWSQESAERIYDRLCNECKIEVIK